MTGFGPLYTFDARRLSDPGQAPPTPRQFDAATDNPLSSINEGCLGLRARCASITAETVGVITFLVMAYNATAPGVFNNEAV